MKTLKVFSPFDQKKIAELLLHSDQEVENALSVAAKVHGLPTKQKLDIPTRRKILARAAQVIESQIDEIALLATLEGGKPITDSRVEISRAIQGIYEASESIKQLVGREIPMNQNAASMQRMAMTIREPIGVVVAISAFNHPFNLIVHQAVTAIAAGCPVIVKPALKTPLSCQKLLQILYEAGLDKSYAQMLCLDNELAEILACDSRVAYLNFIGSAKVGWYLRSRLHPGTRCALEHGGAAPVIVDADVDLDEILPAIAKGGFYHAGQVCVSTQRVFVPRVLMAKFAQSLATMANKMVVGDPCETNTEIGPIISDTERERVHQWVNSAVKAGAELVCGGNLLPNQCYAPTVLLSPPADCEVSTLEIFGPVICLYPYDSIEEAIREANRLPMHFQAAVFSRNIDTALLAAKNLSASCVMINDHTAFRVDWMPFAGRKTSGLGVGGILSSMLEMTEEKLIIYKSRNL